LHDGSFDAVVCQFGVMFFPDKPGSYREVYRVLKLARQIE
jgi:ubiquinone/menaquinone biosynthesis C-methylase UbiE